MTNQSSSENGGEEWLRRTPSVRVPRLDESSTDATCALPLHGIEVEVSRVERPAAPGPHLQVLRMNGVDDGRQAVAVTRWPAHIFRGTGACSVDAKQATVLFVELHGQLDLDSMVPVISKVVCVDEFGCTVGEHRHQVEHPFIPRLDSGRPIGSFSFRRADWIKLMTLVARALPAKSQLFGPMAIGRI